MVWFCDTQLKAALLPVICTEFVLIEDGLFSELVYDDVFVVWESIWAARHCTSEHFVLFIALALLQFYR